MKPTNVRPSFLNVSQIEGVVNIKLSENPFWLNPEYLPRSVISCEDYPWSPSEDLRSLNYNSRKSLDTKTVLLYIGLGVIVTIVIGTLVLFLLLKYFPKRS